MSDAGTPGWYPDPFRRFELRYFNGQRWTGDVSTHGNRMIDPPASGPAMPLGAGQAGPFGAGSSAPFGTESSAPFGAGPAPFGAGSCAPFGGGPAAPFGGGPAAPFGTNGHSWASQPQRFGPSAGGLGQAPRPKRGKAITAFVLAVSAAAIGWFPFVFALAAVAVVLAVVFGIGALRTAKAQDGAGHGFALAALVISPVALAICVGGFFFTRFVMHEIDRYDHPGTYTLSQPTAVTNGTTTTCSGTIRNDGTDTRSYELTISYGQDGVKLAGDVVDVVDVPAGATANWLNTQRITQSGTISCDITSVRGPAPFGIRPSN